MADIQLIIKIPEEIYKASKIIAVQYEDVVQIPLEVIANGTPIPDNATNGQVIRTLFKPNRVERTDDVIVENYDFSKEWLNASYQKGGKVNE